MKIIFKYILTNVKERKVRTAVMLLSIILSTVLLFVSFSIGESYENAQRKMARGMSGTASVSVTSRSETNVLQLEDIPDLPGIKAKAGILKGDALYHENGYYESIDLIGSDLSLLNQINKPQLCGGGEIENFSGYQVILPDRFTQKYGIEKGERIALQIDGAPIEFEVAAIAKYDTVFLRQTRGATALLPLDTLAEITDCPGYSEILIEPEDGISAESLAASLFGELSDSTFTVTQIVDEASIAAGARQKTMPFFLISFFSLTMSIFIIYSSYKVITLDRLPVIGTFRSIGATQKMVTGILLLESLLYGCVGGFAGIPLGILVLRMILRGMSGTLSQGIEISPVISWAGILLSLAAAVIVTLLSAWIPVRRAGRLPVKAVVLGVVVEQKASSRFIMGTGAVLFVISAVLPYLFSGTLLYIAGGLSLLGLIAAAILVIPLVTNLLSGILERIYAILFKNEGMLAARNMRNNKNFTQNITLLFISISAVIAITVVGGFVNTYITDVFNGAELEGFADGEMDDVFIETVKEIDGIDKVLPLYVFNNQIRSGDITFTRLEATDHLNWYNSMFNLNYTKHKMKEQAIEDFETQRSILLSEDCLTRTGYAVGDHLTLSDSGGDYSYLVAGSFKSRATDVEAIIPSRYAISDFHLSAFHFLAYTAADPNAVMVQIRSLFGNTQNWSRTVEEFNSDAHTTVGAFLRPMQSMTYFILLLAAVGNINNLLINYIQRRRTIAMYKSVGLSNKQNTKMMVIESCTTGMIGALIAILVSYLEIKTIFLVAGPRISMQPELDIVTFLSAGAMGIAVTLVSSVVPIIKTRKMKLVEEIKFE